MNALDLSRRGFFGATSAALVAMLAPKKAYSFLTANPLASVAVFDCWLLLNGQKVPMRITASEVFFLDPAATAGVQLRGAVDARITSVLGAKERA